MVSGSFERVCIVVTIASNNQELIVLVDVVYLDVGEGGDYLLLRGKIGALLELKVAYRARQGKVAVDTAEINEAASSLNTCLLGYLESAIVRMAGKVVAPSFCGL